jgi:hypothetical protein
MGPIEAVATTSCSPAAVRALLADASTWARWGSWSKVEVEGGGPQGPNAVRLLVKAPFRLHERITGWVPGERMAYELLDGMRVPGHTSGGHA